MEFLEKPMKKQQNAMVFDMVWPELPEPVSLLDFRKKLIILKADLA